MDRTRSETWNARCRRTIRGVFTVALGLELMLSMVPAPAAAINAPTLDAPSSLAVNAAASFVARATTTFNNERVTSALFTFPANTDLSGVSAATCSAIEQGTGVTYPITSVTANAAARTVTLAINFPKNKPTETFAVTVGGVVNGSQPGAGYDYSVQLTSDRTGVSTTSRAYALTAPATAVGVGMVTLTTAAAAQNAGYTVPVTLGVRGRLAGTTAAGANRMTVTFPSDTVVPAVPPGGSVTVAGVVPAAVAVAGRQVTLTLAAGQTLAGGSVFDVVFAPSFGLVNPTIGGAYTIGVSTTAQTATGTSPGYAVVLDFLTMSIDTAAINFGAVDPGVTAGPRVVRVTIGSSQPVTLTRALTGDVALLGLDVAGTAAGAKPAGVATYADDVTVTPPWNTDPSVTLSAIVTYTATQ